MRKFFAATILIAGLAASVSLTSAQSGTYKVLKLARVGAEGGFDYLTCDVEHRRLYVPRSGPTGQLMVFNLDTLAAAGSIPDIKSGGAAVDPKSNHGFSTTKPITMWDAATLKVIKTIDVDGRPDGIMFDSFNERVWVFSHQPPYATIIDAKEGTVVGTLDLGGAPEEGVSDGKGTVYVNISDKANIAVVDAKNLKVTAHYDVSLKNVANGSGLSLDEKNHVLFAYFRMPSPTVVILSAKDGAILTTLPTGVQVDTVAFNPKTMEAISAEGGGTMTFIKENSPTSFSVEQNVQTPVRAKTITLDTKTGHLYLATSEYGPPPPAAPAPAPGAAPGGRPGGGGRGGPVIPDSFMLIVVGK